MNGAACPPKRRVHFVNPPLLIAFRKTKGSFIPGRAGSNNEAMKEDADMIVINLYLSRYYKNGSFEAKFFKLV
jgi:hypothetical protein